METRSTVFLSAIFAFLAMAVVAGALAGAVPNDLAPAASRSFEFTYTVTVPALPAASAPLRVWIPMPDHDAYQKISDLSIEAPVDHTIEQAEFGDEFAVFVVNAQQASAPFDIVLRFHATRYEHRVPLATNTSLGVTGNGKPADPETKLMLAHWLQPDRLVPTNGVIAELAQQNTVGATDTLDKAHKIYEYVVSTMRYDKTGEGWGHGDAIWACTAKRGNCTDFHSLLIGMMRASGIPARFEIGFPLPADKTACRYPRLSLLGGILCRRNRLDTRGRFRGLEASRQARIFLRRARCESHPVHHRARSAARYRPKGRTTELFYLSLRGARRQTLRQAAKPLLVPRLVRLRPRQARMRKPPATINHRFGI